MVNFPRKQDRIGQVYDNGRVYDRILVLGAIVKTERRQALRKRGAVFAKFRELRDMKKIPDEIELVWVPSRIYHAVKSHLSMLLSKSERPYMTVAGSRSGLESFLDSRLQGGTRKVRPLRRGQRRPSQSAFLQATESERAADLSWPDDIDTESEAIP